MTTLTEFLLARIAEDEDRAAEWTYTENVGAGRVRTVTVPVGITSARVLAECESKRRIVEVCGQMAGPYQVDHIINPTTIAATARADSILRILALPFADNPDFDPAWAV